MEVWEGSTQRSGFSRQAYSEVRNPHLEVRAESGSQPGGLGGVRRTSHTFRRGQEAQPKVREVWTGLLGGLGGPFGGPGGVRKPTRRFGRGWEAYPEVQEGTGGSSGGLGGV